MTGIRPVFKARWRFVDGLSSRVRARNAGDDSEDDEHRRQNADRYANNAGDKACDCLGPAGVASRLRVDLVLDPAADDDPADTHKSANDAAQSQDRAKDAEYEGQCCLRVRYRREIPDRTGSPRRSSADTDWPRRDLP